MTRTFPTQATARAVLARIGRVDIGKSHAMLLCLGEHAFTDKPTLPEGESTSQSLPLHLSLFRLRNVQIFKDKHSVRRGPLDQLFSRLLGKGAGTMALLATKPFHDTSNTSRILVLCLTGRKLGLKAGTRLCSASVLDLDRFPADEEFSPVRVNSYKGIGFIQVNTDRKDTCRFRNIQGNSNTSNELAISLDNSEAVNLDGIGECCLEVSRNGIGEAFSSSYRPDRERPISTKVSITPTLAHKKQSTCFPKLKWRARWFLIRLGRGVGTCNQANSGYGHLSRECSLDAVIARFLQCKSPKGLAIIEAWSRETMLNLSKRLKSAFQVAIRLYDDGHCSLNVHRESIPLNRSIVDSLVASARIPPSPEVDALCALFCGMPGAKSCSGRC